MKVIHARAPNSASEKRSETFTGTVWADAVMPSSDNVALNNVFFSPGGRTHWHTHDNGQVLHVLGGQGWVCKEGEAPQAIRAGDVVWIAPGERHWHGGGEASFMMHLAVSIGTERRGRTSGRAGHRP